MAIDFVETQSNGADTCVRKRDAAEGIGDWSLL